MLERILPRVIDNVFRGHPLALWLFAPVVALKLLMGLNVAGLNPWVRSRYILQTVDAVPVDTFPAAADSAVSFLFQCWGLGLFVLAVLCVVALVRYRAMVPLMIFALAIEQGGRMAIARLYASPHREGLSAAVLINWGLALALLASLLLCLAPPRAVSKTG